MMIRVEELTNSLHMSRRGWLSGCLGCAAAAHCRAQPAPHSWTEQADWSWEMIFRFAYQKELIPLLKSLADKMGKDELIAFLKQSVSERAYKGMANKTLSKRDLATFTANMRSMPSIIQHALVWEVVEDSPQAFEYRVKQCLWAKSFREQNAGDIGYAMVCHPDLAVAAGFNPKLSLTRESTLMEGGECCHFRYEMVT